MSATGAFHCGPDEDGPPVTAGVAEQGRGGGANDATTSAQNERWEVVKPLSACPTEKKQL